MSESAVVREIRLVLEANRERAEREEAEYKSARIAEAKEAVIEAAKAAHMDIFEWTQDYLRPTESVQALLDAVDTLNKAEGE